MWQWEVILRAYSVQIPIIYTNPYFAVFLWYWHYVGHPLEILGYFQESYIQLLLHFFLIIQEHFGLDSLTSA